MKKILFKSLFLVIFPFLFSAPLLSGTSISINNVSGTWDNVTGGPLMHETGSGTNFIYWGGMNQFPGNGFFSPSSYLITGAAPPIFPVSLNTPFTLATLTAHNGVIPEGTAITNAMLNLSLGLSINETPFTNTFSYNLLHDESSNVIGSCCSDLNTILNNNPQTSTFNVGGNIYTLTLTGFEMGNVPTSQFQVNEFGNAVLQLQGIISETVVTPEPAIYLLLGSFLGITGILVFKRRSRRLFS